MMRQILLSSITVVTLLTTCLEGRYHLDATGLRHHRHDRHRQPWDNEELARGSNRKRDWDDEGSNEEELSIDRQYKDGPSTVSQYRRASFGNDRRDALESYPNRGRYDSQRRGRGRNRHGRDYHRQSSGATYWRQNLHEGASVKNRMREGNRHVSSPSGRSEKSWNYRNPSRYDRHRGDDDDLNYNSKPAERKRPRYDDEDDGYESDDEGYYPSRNTGNSHQLRPKGRRTNRHESNNWNDYWSRRKVDVEETEDDDDYDYDPDYEDYDIEESTKPPPPPPPPRRKHNKRFNKYDDLVGGKRKEFTGHPARNDVGGRRGGKKKDRFLGEGKEIRKKPEDFNEVEGVDELDDDVWEDDDYDDDIDFDERNEGESSWKSIDEVIRRLTASDTVAPSISTSKPPIRRDSRNVENYGNLSESKTVLPRVQPHRLASKKPESGPGLTTTSTKKPPFYAKYANSTRNEIGTAVNKKMPRVYNSVSAVDIKKPLVYDIAKADPEAKTKSLEQDYEEYENDGIEDRPGQDIEDVDGEDENDDKKWTSEKEQDYTEEDNADEIDEDTEKPELSTTTVSNLPSTTTSTTTTTFAAPTPMISARSFDHRQSRILDPRNRHNNLKNFQTASTEYPPMSNYSAQKWNTFGSRKAIDSYRLHGKELDKTDTKTAIEHLRKMNREAICRLPRPKVISVREIYPSPSKTYNPSCTLLHRCADDTGCCRSEGTCVPKHSQFVELSFYVSVIGSPTHVEKLKFENHTECECRPKIRLEPPTPPPPPPKPCKCPSRFIARTTADGRCQCNCHDNYLPCLRQKRGKEYFNNEDRWCIHSEECALPSCEWGEYLRRQARCPNLSERVGAVHKFNNSNVRQKKLEGRD